MKTFAARYPGVCAACGGRFDVDDEVCYVDDALVEVDCAEVWPLPRRAEVCPRCYQEKSAAGTCGC